MNKIDELVREMCPDGVEYVRLGDVIKKYSEKAKKDPSVKLVYTVSNKDGLIPSLEYWSKNTKIKIVNYQIYSDDTSNYNIIRENMFAYNPARLNIGSIGCLFDKTVGLLSPMYVIFEIVDKRLRPDFLLKIFETSKVKKFIDNFKEEGARFRFDFKNWNKIQIPLPPLPVQERIVEILDKFTDLTKELKDELTLRKKQYEYYRDALLDFTKPISIIKNMLEKHGEVEYVKLGDLCDVRDGTHNSPKKAVQGKYLLTSKNVKNGTIDYTGAYLISEKDYEEINIRSKVDKWDILFTMIGTIGEIGLITTETDFAIKNVGLIKTNSELLSKFLKHYLSSKMVKKYIRNNKSKGTQPFLALEKLRNLQIPLPPLPVQERIVEILDRFDALCNDLNAGLPAEIEMRTQQYEYYRDKLLSFE